MALLRVFFGSRSGYFGSSGLFRTCQSIFWGVPGLFDPGPGVKMSEKGELPPLGFCWCLSFGFLGWFWFMCGFLLGFCFANFLVVLFGVLYFATMFLISFLGICVILSGFLGVSLVFLLLLCLSPGSTGALLFFYVFWCHGFLSFWLCCSLLKI